MLMAQLVLFMNSNKFIFSIVAPFVFCFIKMLSKYPIFFCNPREKFIPYPSY